MPISRWKRCSLHNAAYYSTYHADKLTSIGQVIYATPPLSEADIQVLNRIEGLRDELRFYLRTPRRWHGTLRRVSLARAIQGSNSIEGYHASVENVAALIADEEPAGIDEETRQAIDGYRDAMTYVVQLAPATPEIDASLLRSLHFMMMKYDLSKHPGQWRPGAIWMEDAEGATVYAAPERELLDALVGELLNQLADTSSSPIIRAAMAHLNLTLVHPFSDGNGRMARCLQTLVLSSDRVISPEFSSIEEYLGRNTSAYYDVLTRVARGAWSPERSARPWLEFCLTAHHHQATSLLLRIREAEALWDGCAQMASRHGLPDRVVGALCDCARGWRLRRSLYVKTVASSTGEVISDTMATRDLAAMVGGGLLEPFGEKRGRHYEATTRLRDLWSEIRDMRSRKPVEDPYAAT